jgi:hypothetical protein
VDDLDNKWYFNPQTGEVAQGLEFDATHRMGPYDSEQAAREALETAQARTEAADEYDEQGDNWGKPASWEK